MQYIRQSFSAKYVNPVLSRHNNKNDTVTHRAPSMCPLTREPICAT